MRLATIFTAALLALALALTPAFAQTVIHDITNAATGDQLGADVAIIGDVDNDGIDDFCVGLPGDDTANANAGRVDMISGATGAVLWTKTGLGGAGNNFGFSVAAAGDANFDGRPDVVVGEPFADTVGTDNGRVEVLNGINGNNISTQDGSNSGDQFGFAVVGVGDINGDFRDDYAVGAPMADPIGSNSGQVRVYSSLGGSTIWVFNGNIANGHFGRSLGGGFDASNNGIQDLIAGAPGANYVRCYSLSNASLRFQSNGTGSYGASVAGFVDINGDNFEDCIVGAPDAVGSAGRVSILSGLNGALIDSVDGAVANDKLGFAVANAGDFNGDGVADIVAGSPAPGGGSTEVSLFTGNDLTDMIVQMSSTDLSGFGSAVAGGGDVNDDGLPDVIIGAPSDSFTGRAVVVGYAPYAGTQEDLVLTTSVNGGEALKDVKDVFQLDVVTIELTSPAGTFSSDPFLLLGQLFTTGTPPGNPGGLATIHVNPFVSPGPFFIIDISGPFGTSVLGTGASLTFSMPVSAPGVSLLIQGISEAGHAANSIYASSHGGELKLN